MFAAAPRNVALDALLAALVDGGITLEVPEHHRRQRVVEEKVDGPAQAFVLPGRPIGVRDQVDVGHGLVVVIPEVLDDGHQQP
jgi:hypothetical protein